MPTCIRKHQRRPSIIRPLQLLHLHGPERPPSPRRFSLVPLRPLVFRLGWARVLGTLDRGQVAPDGSSRTRDQSLDRVCAVVGGRTRRDIPDHGLSPPCPLQACPSEFVVLIQSFDSGKTSSSARSWATSSPGSPTASTFPASTTRAATNPTRLGSRPTSPRLLRRLRTKRACLCRGRAADRAGAGPRRACRKGRCRGRRTTSAQTMGLGGRRVGRWSDAPSKVLLYGMQ